MKTIATVLSWVFHPLLLTTYLVLFLGFYFPAILGPIAANRTLLLKFVLFVFLVTFIFPILNIVLMVKLSGSGATLMMHERRARIAPFLFISLIYCFFAGLFMYKQLLGIYFDNILSIIAGLVLIGTLITFFYKISIHSLALGGLIGIVIVLNQVSSANLALPIAVIILLTGLVMSSRLFLNAHTLTEVLSGVGSGFFIGITGMELLFKF